MRALAVVTFAALCGCLGGGPRNEDAGIDPHGSDAGDQTSGCMSDSE